MLSQCAALGLALASLALSLAAVWGPLPAELIANPLSPKELGNTLRCSQGALLAQPCQQPAQARRRPAQRGACQGGLRAR
jgi:hypothetical protein